MQTEGPSRNMQTEGPSQSIQMEGPTNQQAPCSGWARMWPYAATARQVHGVDLVSAPALNGRWRLQDQFSHVSPANQFRKGHAI